MHDIIINQKIVFLSLDVESGGELGELIQLSAVCLDLAHNN